MISDILPQTFQAKPFLKWVGGKRSILPFLLERLPKEYSDYYEPFVGGGALFFSIQPKHAYLSDINFHLIITYQAVRDDVNALIEQLKIHEKKHTDILPRLKPREYVRTEGIHAICQS